MKEEGLFTSNDAGLAGLAEQLQKALLEWETKKVQGSALKNQDVARTEAEGRQDKATTEDRLSMAFPLEELARALEREKVLRDHLTEHREFYNYALFLALPPAEQALRIVEATSGSLPIGLFEPRVVAMNGSRLAVPLAPTAATPKLNEFVTKLRNSLTAVFQDTLKDVDTTVLPTPGVSVATRLGDCSGCEEYIEKARRVEIRRLSAIARQEMWEATRRERLIGAENYEDFNRPAPSVKLEVENTTAPTP